MLAAAWLRDVVEDTSVTHALIGSEFGDEIATLVSRLTDDSEPGDGNRAKRKEIYPQHLAQAPAAAQTVKLADLIDNTATLVERDPKLAGVFLRESELLLEVLGRGDPTLLERARRCLLFGQMTLASRLTRDGGRASPPSNDTANATPWPIVASPHAASLRRWAS